MAKTLAVADILNRDPAEVNAVTTANARALFRPLKPSEG